METADNKFEMTVDLNALEHLGINLYSNIAAVLTEAVANAWDADASGVQICVDPNNEWIEIEDDGIGMSVDDLNGKYLRVGYRRRDEDTEHGCKTLKGRPVMGRKLSALPVDDEDDRKLMYRHGILAFERMKLRGSTEEFVTSVESADRLLAVLADRDALEASLYRDIVKSRLDAIRDFQTIIDEDAKERVIQKYLFDHLWLLDPAWERATGSQIMESRLTTEGVLVEDLTEKERLGRVDIAYRTHAGKHVIVELKKVGRKMGLLELVEQGQTYVDKLKKILREQNVATPDIEVVFVLGKAVDEEATNPDRLKSSMESIAPGSRIVHYDTLIRGAQEAYSAYIDQSKALDKLEKIVSAI